MTLDPKDLIVLLTPQHTGTHFARMLLESHSRIAFCVNESRRIDVDQRAGYRLTGDGDEPRGSPNETMLDGYVGRHFHGQMSESDFVGSIRYCLSQHLGTAGIRIVRDEIERRSLDQLKLIGMPQVRL